MSRALAAMAAVLALGALVPGGAPALDWGGALDSATTSRIDDSTEWEQRTKASLWAGGALSDTLDLDLRGAYLAPASIVAYNADDGQIKTHGRVKLEPI